LLLRIDGAIERLEEVYRESPPASLPLCLCDSTTEGGF
jgi:hypothetical protein